LREFFKHLERDGIVKRWGSPLLEIPRQHGYYRKLPRFLTEQEMMRLLDSTTDLRDRAMLEFLYASGCRIGELAALRVEDLDFEQCQTVVFGKGKKERVVFFGSKTVEALRAYLNGRTAGPLFPQKRYPDRPMTTRSLARFVSQATVRAGLGHWNPHAFRHSFATHLMNRGVNLVYVQKLLGHENLSTTAVYTHVALADLKKTHEQCHPRG
jgi:site-specific recombinase XerD